MPWAVSSPSESFSYFGSVRNVGEWSGRAVVIGDDWVGALVEIGGAGAVGARPRPAERSSRSSRSKSLPRLDGREVGVGMRLGRAGAEGPVVIEVR